MNHDEVRVRLQAVNAATPVLIAIPTGPGGGGGNRLMPIVRMGHHGKAHDFVDPDEQAGLELFTPSWGTQDSLLSAQKTMTVGDIIARMGRHHDGTHIRIGVPIEQQSLAGLHYGSDVGHHRILHIDTIGFGAELTHGGEGMPKVLPLELITEAWESFNMIVRLDEEPAQ